jgi:hypothetical protein
VMIGLVMAAPSLPVKPLGALKSTAPGRGQD